MPRAEAEPLTAELRRLHVTVTRQFLKKIDAARDGLSHTIPGATMEQVLEAGLDLLLEKQARRRGQVKRPRKTAQKPTPSAEEAAAPTEPLHRRQEPREHVPADVQRAVRERDHDRCVWPLESGGVCGSTHRVEIDHSRVPWARGGAPTVDNLRLLCAFHNALAAKLVFGRRCVERYSRAAERRPHSPPRHGSH